MIINKKTIALLLFIFPNIAISQICNSKVTKTTPNHHFTVNNDGTVTDKTTELTWKVCSEGQSWNNTDGSCTGTATTHNWQQALQAPITLNSQGGYAGKTDWRLPNINELKSIVENSCRRPFINLSIFPETPNDKFRSSTPRKGSSAWIVDFYKGHANTFGGTESLYYIRLVR